ncbi:MAG: hypothetical protein AAFU79_16850, partial [Myxococcota bacterium]
MTYVSGNSVGTFVNDTLGFFGLKGAKIGYAIDTLTGNSIGQLQNLHDMYAETGRYFGTGPIARRMNLAQMGAYGMPAPMAMMPHISGIAGGTYYGGGASQWVDMVPGSTNIPILSKLLNPYRRMAGRFERSLRNNPALRMQFESMIGGRIVDFGFRNDGKMKIQRFGGGYMPNMAMFSPFAGHAFGYMGQMNTAAMGSFGAGALGMFGGNPFNGFLMSGLMNVTQHGAMRGANYGSQGVAGLGWSPFDNSGPMGGRGFGSWNPFAMPGHINNTNPHYENRHQAEGAAILADPSLTVEDQVVLLLMLIMKKADDDIKRQAQYVNSIQQQQAARGDQTNGSNGLLGGFFNNLFGGGILGGVLGGNAGNTL